MYKLILLPFITLSCLGAQINPTVEQSAVKALKDLSSKNNDQFFNDFLNSLSGLKTNIKDSPSSTKRIKATPRGNVKPGSFNDARFYSKFAGAAYCSDQGLNNWSCNHCGVIGQGYKVNKIFTDAFTGGRGYFATNESKKQIILSFRGSSNIQNWIGNLVFAKSKFPIDGRTDIEIHTGFKTSIEALLPLFLHDIRSIIEKNPDYRITVTGHSLGGALATLGAIELKRNLNLPWNKIESFTYGEPRVGNVAFAQWFNDQALSSTRVVNDRDIVPHLPLRNFGFSQHHSELFLNDGTSKFCSNDILEDSACALSNEPFLGVLDHLYYFDTVLGGLC